MMAMMSRTVVSWSLVFGPWSYVANDVGIVGEGDTNEIID